MGHPHILKDGQTYYRLPSLRCQTLLSPSYYRVLRFFGEIDEESTVSGDPYHQLGVLFGVRLCISQRLNVEDIELGVVDVHIAPGSDKVDKLSCRCCRGEPLIKQE